MGFAMISTHLKIEYGMKTRPTSLLMKERMFGGQGEGKWQ